MKKQNRLLLIIITVLTVMIILPGNYLRVFGQQVKFRFATGTNPDENNRSISIMNDYDSSRLIIGTDKGNVYSYEIDKNGLLNLRSKKRYELHEDDKSPVRNINFYQGSDGYFLNDNSLYSLTQGPEEWREIKDFRISSGSYPVLWSMGFFGNSACIVGVYYKNKTTTIAGELFSCTNDINSFKSKWSRIQVPNRKTNYVQLTDIYFNKAAEGWVTGTDGVQGIIWSTDNGSDWKEESTTVSEPLLSIAGTGDKVFAVGLNGLIVKRSSAPETRDRPTPNKTIPRDRVKGERVKANIGEILDDPKVDIEITGTVTEIRDSSIKIRVDRDKSLPNTDPLNLMISLIEKMFLDQDDVESENDKTATSNSSSVRWVPVIPNNPVNERLNSIEFAKDGNHGFIAGSNGTIFFTTNAGKTWVPLSGVQLTGSNLYSIAIDDTHGRCFIAGSEGKVVVLSFGNSGN